jgi:hypothetical protein
MTPAQVQTAIDLMEARGISQSDAMQVLALTAQKLLDEQTLAKAQRTGRSVQEVQGADLGRDIARRLNASRGWK